jgi:hypothetical protein
MTTDKFGDWRIEAVTTIAQDVPPAFPGGPTFNTGDRLYLTTLTRTSNGELIGFTTPNTSALALNVAFSAAKRANELKGQFNYKAGPSPFGTSNSIPSDQHGELFSYFEDSLVSVTFSFQALEAFCNYSISQTWRQPVEVKKRKKEELLHHEVAEREVSTEDKLKSILPKIYRVPTPSGKALWERFVKLKRARDACVHIKYRDQYPLGSQLDEQSLFFQFLDNDPLSFPEAATEMIGYFYSNQEKPRWLQQLPY